MTLSDWNPLSHFKELRTFPKVLLLIGFVFLGVGVATGLSPYNRIAILSLGLISFSLACHYFSKSFKHDVYPPYGIYVAWLSLLWSLMLLSVTAAFLAWLCYLTACRCFIHLPIHWR